MSHRGYQCDRCGAQTATYNAVWARAAGTAPKRHSKHDDAWYDLCEPCALELRAWLGSPNAAGFDRGFMP